MKDVPWDGGVFFMYSRHASNKFTFKCDIFYDYHYCASSIYYIQPQYEIIIYLCVIVFYKNTVLYFLQHLSVWWTNFYT